MGNVHVRACVDPYGFGIRYLTVRDDVCVINTIVVIVVQINTCTFRVLTKNDIGCIGCIGYVSLVHMLNLANVCHYRKGSVVM